MAEEKKTRSMIKREAIISAAKSAFIEHGVQGTSMDKLSELAQVSKRTVYNHFENKEVLVMHIMADMWRKATVQLDFTYQPNMPLHEQLTAILLAEATIFSSQEHIDLSRVAFGHFLYNTEALTKEMDRFSINETTLYQWLEEAIKDSRLKPVDTTFANEQLHSMIKGHCFWPRLLGICPEINQEDLQHLASESAAMFLSHYGK